MKKIHPQDLRNGNTTNLMSIFSHNGKISKSVKLHHAYIIFKWI